MLPYTAIDLIATMQHEYGLDKPSGSASLGTSPNATPLPQRRLSGWMHSVLTVLL